MLHVGLTGGIGSGKSTVARIFRDLGAVVLDADLLVREMLGPGQEAARAVIQAFGPSVGIQGGAVDRRVLASVVFRDPSAKARLEAILHPRVIQRRREILETIRAERGPSAVVVTEAALIFEAGTQGEFDGVLLVTAPVQVRLERLVQAGWDPEEVRRRMDAQWTDERKRPLATWVIENGGDPQEARRQAEALWPIFEEAARGRP